MLINVKVPRRLTGTIEGLDALLLQGLLTEKSTSTKKESPNLSSASHKKKELLDLVGSISAYPLLAQSSDQVQVEQTSLLAFRTKNENFPADHNLDKLSLCLCLLLATPADHPE